MSSISSISFCGGETAGSVSKIASSPKESSNQIATKGSGAETAGSISKFGSSSVVSFCGSGGETAGSVAKKDAPIPANGSSVGFRGYDYEEKKGPSTLGIIASLAGITAAAVIGLAYAHKTDVIGKMSDGKVKDFLMKAKPITEQCHNFCTKTKDKSIKYWNKFIGMFKGKGS